MRSQEVEETNLKDMPTHIRAKLEPEVYSDILVIREHLRLRTNVDALRMSLKFYADKIREKQKTTA
jgi:hypothetical protein